MIKEDTTTTNENENLMHFRDDVEDIQDYSLLYNEYKKIIGDNNNKKDNNNNKENSAQKK